MSRILSLSFLCLVALSACSSDNKFVAEFWRPVSEPNLQMTLDQAQRKLDFDMGQCRCGVFPKNIPQSDLIAYQPDEQRLVQTGVFSSEDTDGSCIQRPSLVVAECMRTRGWEVTKCSGRMPAGEGATICAVTMFDE